jgi:hypothetical protein
MYHLMLLRPVCLHGTRVTSQLVEPQKQSITSQKCLCPLGDLELRMWRPQGHDVTLVLVLGPCTEDAVGWQMLSGGRRCQPLSMQQSILQHH